jgi:hypothetical protein
VAITAAGHATRVWPAPFDDLAARSVPPVLLCMKLVLSFPAALG